MQSPQATEVAKYAETKAWKPFDSKFPMADKSEFVAQVDFKEDHTATADIYYKAGQGKLVNVFELALTENIGAQR